MNDPYWQQPAAERLTFDRAIQVLRTGRWRPESLTCNFDNPFAPVPQMASAMVKLLAEAYSVSIPFVRGYAAFVGRGELDANSDAHRTATEPKDWTAPPPIGPGRFMNAIVLKNWQPPCEVNHFQSWKAPLGPCGQACVDFTMELLVVVERQEIRDFLAGMAQGLQFHKP